jgi:ferritin-like metal-binding protein YciE
MPTTKTRSSARTRRGRSGNASKPANGRPAKAPKKDQVIEPVSDHSQLSKLFIDSLKDIYWAEKHLTKVLPKMKKKATSDQLKDAIEEHLAQTEEHVSRLEQVFEICGKKPQAKKCEAMEGLTKEGDSVLEETENGTMTRDAGIIMAAQKVEHYEIATYGTLVVFAKTLGMKDAADILVQTLREEKDTDEKLTGIAEGSINRSATQEEDDEMEDEETDEEAEEDTQEMETDEEMEEKE